MIDGNVEGDQFLVPIANGQYRAYSILSIFGIHSRQLREMVGAGMPPIRYITQRGPFQNGETPLDLRNDPRTFQIGIADTLYNRTSLYDRRNELLDKLRPSRSFQNGIVYPLIYRKWFPGGKTERGSDMAVTNGSPTVTANNGRFLHQGGLDPGASIKISGVTYVIYQVVNDYTLLLTTNYAGATAPAVSYQYTRGRTFRDLHLLLTDGPQFDMGPGPSPAYPQGYNEVLRFVAHDPYWYGALQQQIWTLPTAFGDLVFDGEGAYFNTPGRTPNGRWLFETSAVSETIEVVYWGTQRARPTIYFDGPASDPSVEHLNTGNRILLDYDIEAGQTITINTLEQTIELNDGTNLIPYFDGDLALFGIEPDPVAPDGVNEIQVSFSGGDPDSSAARMTWRNCYIGI